MPQKSLKNVFSVQPMLWHIAILLTYHDMQQRNVINIETCLFLHHVAAKNSAQDILQHIE